MIWLPRLANVRAMNNSQNAELLSACLTVQSLSAFLSAAACARALWGAAVAELLGKKHSTGGITNKPVIAARPI